MWIVWFALFSNVKLYFDSYNQEAFDAQNLYIQKKSLFWLATPHFLPDSGFWGFFFVSRFSQLLTLLNWLATVKLCVFTQNPKNSIIWLATQHFFDTIWICALLLFPFGKIFWCFQARLSENTIIPNFVYFRDLLNPYFWSFIENILKSSRSSHAMLPFSHFLTATENANVCSQALSHKINLWTVFLRLKLQRPKGLLLRRLQSQIVNWGNSASGNRLHQNFLILRINWKK